MISAIVITILFCVLCFTCYEHNEKLKGGSQTTAFFGDAVWTELYFNKLLETIDINFEKCGVIKCKDDIEDNIKEYKTHKNDLTLYNKIIDLIIKHYRIVFYDESRHDEIKIKSENKDENDEFIRKTDIEEQIKALTQKDNFKIELKITEYDDKEEKEIYKNMYPNESFIYKQTRYEQAINALFEPWFHYKQYNIYYKPNDDEHFLLLSGNEMKTIPAVIENEEKTLKSLSNYEKLIKIKRRKNWDYYLFDYEFLIYINSLDVDLTNETIKKERKDLNAFEKYPGEWTSKDINQICKNFMEDLTQAINNIKNNEDIENELFNYIFNKIKNEDMSLVPYHMNYFDILKKSDFEIENINFVLFKENFQPNKQYKSRKTEQIFII